MPNVGQPIRLGPAVDLRHISELYQLFDFTPDGAKLFLAQIGVPCVEYPCGWYFSRHALEHALFRVHMADSGLVEAVERTSLRQCRLPHTDEQVALLMSLCTIMYGTESNALWTKRVKLLGDQLVKGALRGGRMWRRKKCKYRE